MISTESFIATFSRRYKLALLVIVLAITTSFVTLNEQQIKQRDSAKIINIAGEQRMLSQRLALFTHRLEAPERAQEIQRIAAKLLDNQQFLIEKFKTKSAETQTKLAQHFKDTQLTTRLERFTRLAVEASNKKLINDLKLFEQFDSEQLLLDLNHTVTLFEQASLAQQLTLQRINLALWGLSLLVILFLVFAIFKPTQRWLSETYQKLLLEKNRVKDVQFAINQHAVVMRVDSQAKLLFYNSKFTEQYGFNKKELLGQSIKNLHSGIHSEAFYQEVDNAIKNRNVWQGEICNKAKDGRLYWFDTSIVPIKHIENEVNSSIIIQHDITEKKRTLETLTQIHKITSDPAQSLDEKIERLLLLGREVFNLPLAIVSNIDEAKNSYLVKYASTPNGAITPGTTFEYQHSYCLHTLKASHAIAYHHVGQSDIATHPCYENFSLESYIGCPLVVSGKRIGTLNFSSPEVTPHAFTQSDLEIVQLLAHWISHEFMREEQENKLLSQQQLMAQMSEQANIGAWEFDLATEKVYWSDMTKQIHEVEADFEPELSTAINFYKPGFSQERISELVALSMQTGDPYQEELQIVTAKGNEVWVEAKGQTEFKDGKCVRMFGSFQDITERVEAQNKLKFSNQRLEFVLDSTGVGIWDWEIDSGKTTYNERWANILGYKLSELEPTDTLTWVNQVHPEDFKYSEHALREHWNREKEIYLCEIRMKHKLGHWVWILDTGRVVEWHIDGSPKRMIGTHLDISASKQAEQEIQDKNERMALAADSAGIGIFDYNLVDDTLSWDNWMFKLYGIPESDFSAAYNAWEESLHPDDKASTETLLSEAIKRDIKFDTQFRIILPNGKIRHIKASAINKVNEDGLVTNVVGVNYDVTERVEYEHALKQAKTDAETAVIAKNEFLASMSHEIRTPMNGVIGMLDLLTSSELSDEQQHRVSIAQSSANSLLILINDILDFSKIDADKLELENIPFNLTTLLGELCESFAMTVEAKGLELILDTTELANQMIISDPGRIRQILTNLIGNAIKFTHNGEILISAHLQGTDLDSLTLILTVKDTGIGIAQDKQTHVFETFSQADSSTTRNYGGTGLGLAIVKKLCNRMNGSISLQSTLGEGSEFTCSLQVSSCEKNHTKVPDVDISSLNILVVDDNETNREIIDKQLSQWGAKVTTSHSGEHALTLCKSQTGPMFDIAILDMQMPNMDGAQLAQYLQNLPECEQMQLIMMTSIQTRGDAKYFADLGFKGYFPKPTTTQDLLGALKIISDKGDSLKNAKPLITHHYINELQQTDDTSGIDDLKHLLDLNILLVEDNPVNQIVAKGVLKNLGLKCDCAENGQQALTQLNSQATPYDVILMDVQMPEMDGFQATRLIRQGKAGLHHQSTYIIAMTANAMEGDKEKCLDAGMNEYIAKPINLNALKTALLSSNTKPSTDSNHK
ncbi:PAS domain-containing protein [Pseudoalteromonas sp. BZB3]|uniref:PAS domain-containing protein n=1 Tax=Pseudoalteromonas sp. BZB3 TaxID=3136670 RepID=UPI0032C3F228